MAAPLKITFSHLEEGPTRASKASFWEDPTSSGVTLEKPSPSNATYGGSPAEVLEEKSGEDDMHPMVSLMPPVNVEHGSFHDLVSARMWGNHVIWRAGIIEGVASGSLNVVSGLMAATISTWPRAVVPVGILIGNTLVVSCIISATAAATGAHVNSIVTMATAFSGHCHPVRAVIYIFCQLLGGGLGGSLLRVALGKTLALKIHNGGCWIDPDGEVNVWQAALIEFVCAFILLFLGYGLGLDPRQAKLFGAKYGPVLIGLVVGIITSVTATIHPGYTGAGIFPGRCLGLAVGIGEFQTSHWVWWVPDILAAAVQGLLYTVSPTYMKAPPV